MQKLIDFIRVKSINDPSMATVIKLLQENPDRLEDCLLLVFDAIYSTNLELQQALAKNNSPSQPRIILPK